jgi:exosome complex component RRP4
VKSLPTFFESKELVTPGDLLAEGDYIAGENTYQEDKKIFAERIGLVEYDNRKVRVVALRAFYIPRIGDVVIGMITEVGFNGWEVDINAPYTAILRASDVLERGFRPQKNDLLSILDIGDLVIAKVTAYDRGSNPVIKISEPGLGKISRGQLIKVTPTKIPRIIGRKGSMISMIKRETNCRITLGQNGLIIISGKTREDEQLAIMALRKVEDESHTSGLTDRIAEMIRKEKEGRRKNVQT